MISFDYLLIEGAVIS